MFDLTRYTPHVEEGQAIAGTVASGVTSTVLSDIPTIHAQRIDVVFSSVVSSNDAEITLRMYGASKKVFIDVALGTVTAGTKAGFVYGPASGEFIGQVCDIRVENNNGQATAAPLIYTLWIGARP